MLSNSEIQQHVDKIAAIGSKDRNGAELTDAELKEIAASAAVLICSTLQAVHVIARSAHEIVISGVGVKQ